MGLKQLVAENSKSCTVALPRACNHATFDEIVDNSCNRPCNHNATDGLKGLQNKDSVCNHSCNTNATVQKTTVQLFEKKTPEKLHGVAEQLHRVAVPFLPVSGGGNSVISANSDNALLAANDYQRHHVAAQPEPLATPEIQELPDRYRHLVQCQHCEHLTFTGHCRMKTGYKPMPDAKRACSRHQPLQEERQPVAATPYTATELDALLGRYERRLLAHVVDCPACRTSDRRWCAEGFAVGLVYEAMLLCFEDAEARHDRLVTKVVRERVRRM